MAVERSTNQAVNTAKAAYRLAKQIRIGGKKMAKGKVLISRSQIRQARKTAGKVGSDYMKARGAGLRGRSAISAALSTQGGRSASGVGGAG